MPDTRTPAQRATYYEMKAVAQDELAELCLRNGLYRSCRDYRLAAESYRRQAQAVLSHGESP